MATPDDVLARWVASATQPVDELWRLAAKALPAMSADLDAAVRACVIDRFLDEDPATLYRAVAKMDPTHWPALVDAFGRCTDAEAIVLRAVKPAARPKAAQLVALLAKERTGYSAGPVARSKLCTPDVVAACVAVFARGYPPYQHALSGIVAAIVVHGTTAQIRTFTRHRPPDEALGWLGATMREIPAGDRNPLRELIGERQEIETEWHEREGRFKRAHRAPAVAARPTSSAKDLLAQVYEAPEANEPRAVYADWLISRGEPLGELIQLQLARARGKKGTLAAEKLIIANHAPNQLWPEHPAAVLSHARLALDRGFPAGIEWYFANDGKPYRGHPGWRTLRRIATNAVLDLLPDEMPILDEVRTLSLQMLDGLRDRSWPIRTLGVTGLERIGAVTGFPKLERLDHAAEGVAPSAVLDALRGTGLLERIQTLSLWSDVGVGLQAVLALFDTVPAQVRRIRVENRSFRCDVVRDSGFEASIDVEAGLHGGLVADLAALGASSLKTLDVIVVSNGKHARAQAVAEIKKSLGRLKKTRTSLTSRHPDAHQRSR